MDKQEFELKRQRGETVQIAVVQSIKWGALCIIAFCGYRAVAALAGRTTTAQFGMFLLADLKANSIFSHIVTSILGLGGITYGVKQKRLQEKNIERLSRQNAELESRWDTKRTSSSLTPRGTTRPEDRI
jgi:hypothetical protein